MSERFTSSFRTCRCPGGVEGANCNNRRLGASVRFAPMPPGTDTAGPARNGNDGVQSH
jgi:hypothetical protein